MSLFKYGSHIFGMTFSMSLVLNANNDNMPSIGYSKEQTCVASLLSLFGKSQLCSSLVSICK